MAVIGRLDFHQFGENCDIVGLLLLKLNHAKDGRTATALPITTVSTADARQNSVIQYQL